MPFSVKKNVLIVGQSRIDIYGWEEREMSSTSKTIMLM